MPSPEFRSKSELIAENSASFTAVEPKGSQQNDVLIAVTLVGCPDGFNSSINYPEDWEEFGVIRLDDSVLRIYGIRRGENSPDLTWSWGNKAYSEFIVLAYSGIKETNGFIEDASLFRVETKTPYTTIIKCIASKKNKKTTSFIDYAVRSIRQVCTVFDKQLEDIGIEEFGNHQGFILSLPSMEIAPRIRRIPSIR